MWHKHKWGEWVEVTPATCESAGRKIRICKRNSSHVEEQEIPALGHDWGEWAVETQHGCETAGIEVRTCKNDPTHQERRDIPFLGHDWGDWSVETQPNCEAAGLETRTCRRDASHVEKREITELGHDWIPATFTQPQYCSRCGISSGRPSPESTFPTVEEVKYLFDHNTHNTVSNTGASLVLPNNGSFLSTPYRARVKASRTGGRIYIMPVPKSGNGNLGTIVDGTEVVIVAKQSGYLFFVSYDGTMGWNGDVFFGEH